MSAVEQNVNGRAGLATMASRGGGGGTDASVEQENVQETLTKFKRLLSLARRSIEENQRQITEKDSQIVALREALTAAETAQRRSDEHAGASPSQLLRRIREGGMWWLLVEYDDEYETQGWKGFPDEAAVREFADVNVGEPLGIPPVSLSPDESATVLEDARKQVANIREEYRKYRVKAELTRKQRDAEFRQVSAESIAEKQRRISGQGAVAGVEQMHALEDEVQRLRNELTDKEETWRHAYEKQVQETEVLKREGGDTALAAQWRQRYEKLSLEKEDAMAKLDMFKGDGGASGGRGGGGQGEAVASLMKKYQDLKEEYRLYRKKAMHAIQGVGAAGGGAAGAPDPKLQYLKNLMLKYLGTDEGEAREHMERAVATVLQFSEEERRDLKNKREAQTMAWMSNFTGMFGGAASGGSSSAGATTPSGGGSGGTAGGGIA